MRLRDARNEVAGGSDIRNAKRTDEILSGVGPKTVFVADVRCCGGWVAAVVGVGGACVYFVIYCRWSGEFIALNFKTRHIVGHIDKRIEFAMRNYSAHTRPTYRYHVHKYTFSR